MVFIPTYLYIKQHSITGKLYFGKTTKKNPVSYKGSGKRWLKHIKKHGTEYVVTLWYHQYDNIFDLVADALSMSKSFNITKNDSWLNLIPENGLDGAPMPPEFCSMRGKFGSAHPMFGRKRSIETRLKHSKSISGERHHNFGKTPSPESTLKRIAARTTLHNFSCPFGIIFERISIKEITNIFEFNLSSFQSAIRKNKPFRGVYIIPQQKN